jgi:ribosomal protein S19E (S16A)
MQQIAKETVEYLRQVHREVNITTGSIERGVVQALRKSGLAKKVEEQDVAINSIRETMKRIGGLFSK